MAGLPDVGQGLQRERRWLGDGRQREQAALLTKQGAGSVKASSSRSCASTNNPSSTAMTSAVSPVHEAAQHSQGNHQIYGGPTRSYDLPT